MANNQIVLTIDLEDWFHSLDTAPSNWGNYERRIEYGTKLLLNLLAEKKSIATFFVLGDVAKNHPDLIKQIDQEGHEIGSHGFNHEFIYKQTQNEFRNDLSYSLNYLSDLTGKSIISYRAPYFSITKESLWAFNILAEEGIKIDSSIFPVINHRYGIPNNKRLPYRLPNGIWEFPITTYRTFLGNIPFAGGVYFRFLPLALSKFFISTLIKRKKPVLTYFHPWEFDSSQPILNGISWFLKLRHYYALKENYEKFSELIDDINVVSLAMGIKEIKCEEENS